MTRQPLNSAFRSGLRGLPLLFGLLLLWSLNSLAQDEEAPDNGVPDNGEAAAAEVDAPEPEPEVPPEEPIDASREARDNRLLAAAEPEQVRWLETPQGTVPALFTLAETRVTKGALLLLHTADQPPGWPLPLEQLRRQLPRHGWATLALNLPSPGAEERNPIIAARLDAALAFLRDQGQLNITLLVDNGSAAGVVAAGTNHISTDGNPLEGQIRALVMINLLRGNLLDREGLEAVFAAPALPVLDIFLTPEPAGQAEQRRRQRAAAMRAGVEHYQPLLLPGPELARREDHMHYWSQRVRGFMARHAEGIEIPNPVNPGF
ncbi:DUF3530 family protein [Marinimicrobium alkaliphilum]|uniref:DUF3530 family protein n=1 Tax=Marinimicrobium alkaliphilum TaxID=2202654 RepID=UPI000DB9F894|nr:DUF3530 family protein [Marinimicrobium alkaliphilum]